MTRALPRTPRASVSVVIPTVGRPELRQAINSALEQDYGVHEVLVCSDVDHDLTMVPKDPRVRVLRTGPGLGGNVARQAGIAAASGELIALLDDDDEWLPRKLSSQLNSVRERDLQDDAWISTSRLIATRSNSFEVWPSELIGPSERIGQYIFRKHRPKGGQGFIQASTLLFPRTLGLRFPFDPERRFHQDIDWLLEVDQNEPNLVVIQCPDALTKYTIGAPSVSKSIDPRLSLEWARKRIKDDPRSLGDFILTTVVIYAARRGDPRGVIHFVRAGRRIGEPGWPAHVFAAYQLFCAYRVKYERRNSR